MITALMTQYSQPRGALALDVREDGVDASVLRRGEAPGEPLRLALPDWAEDPQRAGRELARALEEAGIRERRCVVCLPASWALAASADLPKVNDDDLRGYFELRAEREFSTPGLRLAHSRYDLPDGARRATLAGIPAKRIEPVEQMLSAAGCRIVSLALALGGSPDAPEPALHFAVRDGTLDLWVSIGGGVALLRSLPGGGESAALVREIRITLGRLPEAIRTQLRTARWVGPAIPGVGELLKPLGIADFREETEPAAPAVLKCAEEYLERKAVPFEFVVPEVNRWSAHFDRLNTSPGRRIAAWAAGIAVLLVLVFIVRSHTESSLQADWNGMRGRVSELDAIQQNIRHFRPWFSAAPQKLPALEALFAAFPARGDVWARSVQMTPYLEKGDRRTRAVQSTEAAKVTVSGFSRSQAAVMSLQDHLRKEAGVSALQLQQLRGNNPIQFSLTFKWEPTHEN